MHRELYDLALVASTMSTACAHTIDINTSRYLETEEHYFTLESGMLLDNISSFILNRSWLF